jgi:DNA-binding MarR family transcriptional regulator
MAARAGIKGNAMRRSMDLMQLLTRAERLLARRLTAILAAEGHGLEAWRVITLLADGKGHFMTEVAEHAFLPPGSLTRLVDQLVEDALLYRRVDDIDRRRIRAYLTPRGQRLHHRIAAEIRSSLAGLPAAGELERHLTSLVDELDPARLKSPSA